MAFWGIEVKPGKPFTQKSDDFKGRLHVSVATLGFGSAANKSVLQCNKGNKSPIYLCSLLPSKVECLQLNLEFEEADDVVFSVIGPRSIHISGYFLGRNQHALLNNDSESFGEDIANTETEGSVYGDDEYEDSFINDDDPEILPPSPVPIRGKVLGKNSSSGLHTRKRLRKKYQLDESDDQGHSHDDQGHSQRNDNSDIRNTTRRLESDEDNSIPISAFLKGRTNVIHSSPETERNYSPAEICKKSVADDHSVAEVRGETHPVTVNDQPSRTDNQKSLRLETFQATGDKNIKKKKKCKKEDTMDVDVPVVPSDEKIISAVEVEDKNKNISNQTSKLNGVIVEELKPGMPEGKVAVAGKKVSVTYSGKLKTTGEIFESNNNGNPFKFRLGVGKVIKGWDVGIDGMVVGERRRITIPPSMGFGEEGYGGKVSPNSWLIYEIELVKVR